jgi:hypothetical protein
MQVILPDFLTLDDYYIYIELLLFEEAKAREMDRKCPTCRILNALHIHGSYDRYPDRPVVAGKKSLNPIKILRFICKYAECKKTCSFLPECIPPRRWYIWKLQQSVIQRYFHGCSWKDISVKTDIPISTCKRWCKWLVAKHNDYAFILKNVAGNLKDALLDCANDFKQLWRVCFTHISLDRAMLLCHKSGVATP